MHLAKRCASLALLGAAVALAACFSPELGEGRIHCGSGGACPPGFHCAGDQRCYSSEVGPDGSSGDGGACVPLTCANPPRCGQLSDGCGHSLSCGSCAGTSVCGGGGTAGLCCVPAIACPTGADCGFAPDGCGGSVDCGGLNACGAQKACGGGGTANVCGPAHATCTPRDCAAQGKVCGTTSDGCGNVIASCGLCPAGKSCVSGQCQ
ncbi:MAG TPA: hypothetical protein VII38_19525 [Polyangia bacterium]